MTLKIKIFEIMFAKLRFTLFEILVTLKILFYHAAAERDGLINSVRKAELSKNEIQLLIDLLLNKQLEAPAIIDEWSEVISLSFFFKFTVKNPFTFFLMHASRANPILFRNWRNK